MPFGTAAERNWWAGEHSELCSHKVLLDEETREEEPTPSNVRFFRCSTCTALNIVDTNVYKGTDDLTTCNVSGCNNLVEEITLEQARVYFELLKAREEPLFMKRFK
jgi:hypothetical protein